MCDGQKTTSHAISEYAILAKIGRFFDYPLSCRVECTVTVNCHRLTSGPPGSCGRSSVIVNHEALLAT